jgi:hypothetical protein
MGSSVELGMPRNECFLPRNNGHRSEFRGIFRNEIPFPTLSISSLSIPSIRCVQIRARIVKGLKVWWHDATLFVYFSYFTIYKYTFNHIHTTHLSVAIRRGLSPSLHRF